MNKKIGLSTLAVTVILGSGIVGISNSNVASAKSKEEDVSITTCQQLNYLESNNNYFLENDLDCGSNTINNIDKYKGNFEGNGHTISNIAFNESFIKNLDDDASFKNVMFDNLKITNSKKSSTGIVGVNEGTIENVIVKNSKITGYDNVGAIVGENEGTVSNVQVSGTRVESDNDDVGAIAGSNNKTLTNASVIDSTSVTGKQHVGGIVGINKKKGEVSGFEVESKTKVKSMNYGGGVVGDNLGTLENGVVTNVNIGLNNNLIINFKDNYNFGSVVGKNEDNGSIKSVTSENNTINIEEGYNAGGFVGQNDGLIEECIIQTINISAEEKAGGFAGANYGDINSSKVLDGTVNGGNYIGGFVGLNKEDSRRNVVKNIAVNGNDYVGGFAGYSDDGKIYKSVVKNSVVSGNNYVGGLVGLNLDEVDYSAVYADVEGYNYVGGSFGEVSSKAEVQQVYNTGSVKGFDHNIGGFAGSIDEKAHIDNSFTRSTVNGYNKVSLFAPEVDKNSKLVDCYYVAKKITVGNGTAPIVTAQEIDSTKLSDSSFYRETLNYSDENWIIESKLAEGSLPAVNLK